MEHLSYTYKALDSLDLVNKKTKQTVKKNQEGISMKNLNTRK